MGCHSYISVPSYGRLANNHRKYLDASYVYFGLKNHEGRFLERSTILSGIQFTKYFIELVFVGTNHLIGSDPNMIYTRETCGQCSSVAAGSCVANDELAYLFIRFCYMFLIWKCRHESNLGLCTSAGLAKTMRLCSGDFRWFWRPNAFFNWKLPLHSCIVFARPENVHRPRSYFFLRFDFQNI